MSATVFLMINGLIVAYLLLRLFKDKAEKPTALRLESEERQSPVVQREPAPSFNERSLNCYFQFNGHMWDAFEVLGIPAGSSREACDRAMLDMRRRINADQEFLTICSEALAKYFS